MIKTDIITNINKYMRQEGKSKINKVNALPIMTYALETRADT